MAKLSKKQTGSVNKKDITRKGKKARKIKNPWGGPPVPLRSRNGQGTVQGSSTRKPTSDPSLKGMDYPPNKPYEWPVEPDFDNHTLPPPASGLTDDVIDNFNATVEQAYTRAGYQ